MSYCLSLTIRTCLHTLAGCNKQCTEAILFYDVEISQQHCRIVVLPTQLTNCYWAFSGKQPESQHNHMLGRWAMSQHASQCHSPFSAVGNQIPTGANVNELKVLSMNRCS